MKRNLTNEALIGVAIMGFLIGCSNSAKTGKITSGLAMSGSAKAAAVVKNTDKPKNLLSLFLPKANAYVPSVMVDSTGLAITLTSAWAAIKEIELQADEVKGAGEVSGSEVSFHGPYFVDLLSNTPITLDTQQITAALYHRVKLQFHSSGGALPAAAPAQLSTNSIVMQGLVGTNNFEFDLDDSTEMNIGGANGVMPTDGGTLLIEINFADIFKQIDMSSVLNNEIISGANRHSTTCPSIDPSATDIYSCVRKSLEMRANFGEDRNSDGALDSGEDAVK